MVPAEHPKHTQYVEDLGVVHDHSFAHPVELLTARVMELAPPQVIDDRYGLTNRFEAVIVTHGTTIVRLFLYISVEEQQGRLLARLREQGKQWKFNGNDISERGKWYDYQAAYAAALGRCSTAAAPWYAIPANRNWYRNWAISQLLIEAIEAMKLTYPHPHLDVRALKTSLRAAA